MTREEALKILHNASVYHPDYLDALNMAIKALEPKPYEKFESAKDHIYKLAGDYKCWDNRLTNDEAIELCHILEQELCEDAVSREAVLEQAYAYGNGLEPDGYCVNVEDIQALPSVTPTRQKGRWIPHEAKYNKTASIYECSICHKNNGFMNSKYCPHCGAEMEIKE